jgi:hypothetical protein
MRTVLNGRGKPVVLTPENCTRDDYLWGAYVAWEEVDWKHAEFRPDSLLGALGGRPDPHISVPHKNGETAHRIRGKGWKITGLLP